MEHVVVVYKYVILCMYGIFLILSLSISFPKGNNPPKEKRNRDGYC